MGAFTMLLWCFPWDFSCNNPIDWFVWGRSFKLEILYKNVEVCAPLRKTRLEISMR